MANCDNYFRLFMLMLLLGFIQPFRVSFRGCAELNAEATVKSLDLHDSYRAFSVSNVPNASNADSSYPNNYERCWRIEVPEGYVLKIWTEPNVTFSIASGINCSSDFLLISCSETGEDGFAGRYCASGTNLQSAVYVDSDIIFVKFKTNESVVAAGFRLYYQAVSFTIDASIFNCKIAREETAVDLQETGSGFYDDSSEFNHINRSDVDLIDSHDNEELAITSFDDYPEGQIDYDLEESSEEESDSSDSTDSESDSIESSEESCASCMEYGILGCIAVVLIVLGIIAYACCAD